MSDVQISLEINGPLNKGPMKVVLKPGQIFIVGRRDCSLSIDDPKISRRHLSLSIETGELVADDLGSHNGTLFNGVRGTTKTLEVGDVILVGNHELRLTELSVGKAAAASTVTGNEKAGAEDRFTFFPSDTFNWRAIQKAYVNAAVDPRHFWQSLSYGIPLEHSLTVLGVMAMGYGLVGGLHFRGFSGIVFAVFMATTTLAVSLLGSALLSAIQKWLQMKGKFAAYVAFATYYSFLSFPFFLLSQLSSALASVLTLGVSSWAVWGFAQVFMPNFRRYYLFIGGLVLAAVVLYSFTFYVMMRMLTRSLS